MTDTSPYTNALALLRRHRLETEERLAGLTSAYADIVESSKESNADDEHDPEGTTIAFERSQVAALIAQARDHLAEVDSAEARVSEGTYGVCEGCGEPIAPERLEVRPFARTCVRCARSQK